MADVEAGSASRQVSEKVRKSHVRVMTEKRREQNRRAQKLYRERLRKKLEGFEEQVAASNNIVKEREEVGGWSMPDRGTGVVSEPVIELEEERSLQTSNFINLSSILEAAGDLAVESSITPSFQFPIAPPSPSPPPRAPLYSDAPLTSKPLDIWPMPQRAAGAVYSPPLTASATYMAGALTALSPDYAWTRQRRLLDQSPDAQRNHRPSRQQQLQLQHHRHHSLPSPHINFINLTSESNLSASLAIALSLGISRDAYLEDHPSNFPTCFDNWYPQFNAPHNLAIRDVSEPGPSVHEFLLKSQDPASHRYTFVLRQRFITPLLEGRDGSGGIQSNCDKFRAAAWATVYGAEEHAPTTLRRHMSRIKTPLRPRPMQLLWSHPSYLDCIVFPRFRERAVQASVDGRLDHVEFFLDLMHGGLVCWGNSTPNPMSGGRRKRRGRGMAEGMPWSTRSWEARRWFLEKWEWLVGTEEEELAEGAGAEGIWACSRWWWGMRGELEDGEDEENDGDGDESESEEAVLRRIYEGCDGSIEGAGRFDLKGTT